MLIDSTHFAVFNNYCFN